MKKLLQTALALMSVGAMVTEADAQFRVVKDGTAILVMEEGVPDYVSFDNDEVIDGHLSLEQLLEKTTVTIDKSADGRNGNVINCQTTACVNAKWTIDGVAYHYNSFTKNLDKGEHTVVLEALCVDGTKLSKQFTVTCDVITTPKSTKKVWIYGGPDNSGQRPFVASAWVSADMRFSDYEGKNLPFLSDDVYWGHKTLIFDISEVHAGTKEDEDKNVIYQPATMRVMNGWWSATYQDEVKIQKGLWELPITEEMAQDCARGGGGDGKDLQVMVTSGSMRINGIYYLEDDDKAQGYTASSQSNTGIVGKAVDLGLSVKWSSVNLGASKPQEAGDYFA